MSVEVVANANDPFITTTVLYIDGKEVKQQSICSSSFQNNQRPPKIPSPRKWSPFLLPCHNRKNNRQKYYLRSCKNNNRDDSLTNDLSELDSTSLLENGSYFWNEELDDFASSKKRIVSEKYIEPDDITSCKERISPSDVHTEPDMQLHSYYPMVYHDPRIIDDSLDDSQSMIVQTNDPYRRPRRSRLALSFRRKQQRQIRSFRQWRAQINESLRKMMFEKKNISSSAVSNTPGGGFHLLNHEDYIIEFDNDGIEQPTNTMLLPLGQQQQQQHDDGSGNNEQEEKDRILSDDELVIPVQNEHHPDEPPPCIINRDVDDAPFDEIMGDERQQLTLRSLPPRQQRRQCKMEHHMGSPIDKKDIDHERNSAAATATPSTATTMSSSLSYGGSSLFSNVYYQNQGVQLIFDEKNNCKKNNVSVSTPSLINKINNTKGAMISNVKKLKEQDSSSKQPNTKKKTKESNSIKSKSNTISLPSLYHLKNSLNETEEEEEIRQPTSSHHHNHYSGVIPWGVSFTRDQAEESDSAFESETEKEMQSDILWEFLGSDANASNAFNADLDCHPLFGGGVIVRCTRSEDISVLLDCEHDDDDYCDDLPFDEHNRNIVHCDNNRKCQCVNCSASSIYEDMLVRKDFSSFDEEASI